MKLLRLMLLASLCLLVACPNDDPADGNNDNNENNTNNSNNGTNNTNNSNNANNSNNSTNNANNSNNANNTNNTNNSNNANNTNNTNNTNGCAPNDAGGQWNVDVVLTPNQASVGGMLQTSLTLTNFTLCDDIGGENATNTGHYSVYLTQVDPDYELVRSADNPAMFTLDLANVDIMPGMTNIIVVVYQNDMTNFNPPVEITIPFTVITLD